MINVQNLSKTYKVKQNTGFWKSLFSPTFSKIKAVDDISFTIHKGELVGFIGPNGAGKTTTIKMLVGILWPTSGQIQVNGVVPYKQRKDYLYHVGTVFGQRKSLWPELSVMDNLELIGSYYKLDKQTITKRVKQLSKIIKIQDFIQQPFRKLSLGQQMKAELLSALIHKPKILYLDEPTIGMDIIAKADFLQLLKQLNKKEKTTIMLTSHDLHEIEQLCERIIIINTGKLLYDGKVEEVLPDKVILQYEQKGVYKNKTIKKARIKEEIAKIKSTDIRIKEIPLEQVIRKFYS